MKRLITVAALVLCLSATAFAGDLEIPGAQRTGDLEIPGITSLALDVLNVVIRL